MAEYLGTYSTVLTAAERRQVMADPAVVLQNEMLVTVRQGSPTSLAPLNLLLADYQNRFPEITEDAIAIAADQWLAPRLHSALRLTRRQASDKQMWLWLAMHYPAVVETRWGPSVKAVRWFGRPTEQAFSRLWWTAEIFRRKADYEPVERALARQRVVDRFALSVVVRNRAMAIAILDFIVPREGPPKSRTEMELLAKSLNLATTGTTPAVEIGVDSTDNSEYQEWLQTSPSLECDWNELPPGPPNGPNAEEIARAREIVERCWSFVPNLREYEKRKTGKN